MLILSVFFCIIFIIIASLTIVFSKNRNLKEKFTHNIAIIGLPQSGKTTFITSTFGAVMYGKINLSGYNAIVKGNSTIDRINQNLSLLDKGIPIGATTDQTLFAYRLNIEEQNPSFFRSSKEYQIEFGDFQGEMTEGLIDLETNIWRHDSEFFNWIKDANAFVLIIDLGKYLLNKKDYVPEISKSLRSAWQKILELNDYRKKEILKQPVILIFNKADLLVKYKNLSQSDIDNLAFSKYDKLPEITYSNIDKSIIHDVEIDFENLIDFFSLSCNKFGYYFYSSFLADKYEYRQGLSEICSKIFPFNIEKKLKKRISLFLTKM
jgi:hypothetical protein